MLVILSMTVNLQPEAKDKWGIQVKWSSSSQKCVFGVEHVSMRFVPYALKIRDSLSPSPTSVGSEPGLFPLLNHFVVQSLALIKLHESSITDQLLCWLCSDSMCPEVLKTPLVFYSSWANQWFTFSVTRTAHSLSNGNKVISNTQTTKKCEYMYTTPLSSFIMEDLSTETWQRTEKESVDWD